MTELPVSRLLAREIGDDDDGGVGRGRGKVDASEGSETRTEAERIQRPQWRLRSRNNGLEELVKTTEALAEKDEPEELTTTTEA